MKFLSSFNPKNPKVEVFGVKIGKNFLAVLKKIREVSEYVEILDPLTEKNRFDFDVLDRGNFYINEVEKLVRKISSEGKVPLMLSLAHLPSFFSIKNFKSKKIVIFDAHCDLKRSYMDEKIKRIDFNSNFNEKFNDATWLLNLLDIVKGKNLMLLGIRSFDEEELNILKFSKINYLTSFDLKSNFRKSLKKIEKFCFKSEIYFSLDMDVFDSCYVNVEYPEPGGISYYEFKKILDCIKGKAMGIDVCCFKNDEKTLFLAVNCIFDIFKKV